MEKGCTEHAECRELTKAMKAWDAAPGARGLVSLVGTVLTSVLAIAGFGLTARIVTVAWVGLVVMIGLARERSAQKIIKAQDRVIDLAQEAAMQRFGRTFPTVTVNSPKEALEFIQKLVETNGFGSKPPKKDHN